MATSAVSLFICAISKSVFALDIANKDFLISSCFFFNEKSLVNTFGCEQMRNLSNSNPNSSRYALKSRSVLGTELISYVFVIVIFETPFLSGFPTFRFCILERVISFPSTSTSAVTVGIQSSTLSGLMFGLLTSS